MPHKRTLESTQRQHRCGSNHEGHLRVDIRILFLSARGRAFARLLTATSLRRLGQIDALIAARLNRPLPEALAAVRNILRIGAVQLVALDAPAHAVVDTAVRLAERIGRASHKGLVNAVLRRLAAEGPALFAAQDAARLNTPGWLWQSWAASHGEATARAIAVQHLRAPPLDLTVKGDAPGWAARLGGTVIGAQTVRLAQTAEVTGLAGFAEGAWWVQDAAAALPARLLLSALGGGEGKRVVDLCAAAEVPRLPAPRRCDYLGLALPLLALAPFEDSAVAKLRLAARARTDDIISEGGL